MTVGIPFTMWKDGTDRIGSGMLTPRAILHYSTYFVQGYKIPGRHRKNHRFEYELQEVKIRHNNRTNSPSGLRNSPAAIITCTHWKFSFFV